MTAIDNHIYILSNNMEYYIQELNTKYQNDINLSYEVINELKIKQQNIQQLLQQLEVPFEQIINTFDKEEYQLDSVQMICNKKAYISSFDIASVTNSITGASFSTGYVFAQTQNIKNAFIDIADNVYSSQVSPLFQNQVQYYNIKIQIGAQTFSQSGTILSGTSEVIISSMNIISRKDTTLSNLAALHILQSTSTSSYILGLMININLTNGQGNISLISSMVGTLNIKNYQLSGSFESTGTVALGALYSISSQVKVNRFNFNPNSFTVGNASSFLFTSICQSLVQLTRITILIGTSNLSILQNVITSTSSYPYQFGGLITQIDDSKILTAELSYTSYIIQQTQYINNSGLFFGLVLQSTSSIILKGICFTLEQQSVNTYIDTFGIIGKTFGLIYCQNIKLTYNISQLQIYTFGMIGNITTNNHNILYFKNICLNGISGDGSHQIGGISGYIMSTYCNLEDIFVNQLIVFGEYNSTCGLIISYTNFKGNVTRIYINSSRILNVQTGGMFGNNINCISLNNILINNYSISSYQYSGAIFGQSKQAYISDILIQNSIIQSFQQSSCVAAQVVQMSICNLTAKNNSVSSNYQSACLITYGDQLILQQIQIIDNIIKLIQNVSISGYLGGLICRVGQQFNVVDVQLGNNTMSIVVSETSSQSSQLILGGILAYSQTNNVLFISKIIILESILIGNTVNDDILIGGILGFGINLNLKTIQIIGLNIQILSGQGSIIVGTICAQILNSGNVQIDTIDVKYINIQTQTSVTSNNVSTYIASLIALIRTSAQIYIKNLIITSTSMQYKGNNIYFNFLFVKNQGDVQFINSFSQGQNYQNGVKITNCGIFFNNSLNGC
ncbi:Hypothetical_protein [Hexamita inflata]|uniref:Hypothetical_protein n=1 Tax=Hexamita inflata TaxID=28002 RepID=A0AA86R596_9EUKA|nr:Hypothetical protein HINF_LOCUS56743 [Hexamita inflata]